jgi:curved DNA-binding protein CbpA
MINSHFGERDGDNSGMRTALWGPGGWLFLHSIAQNYPWKPTDEQKEDYFNFFRLTGNVLPCRYCRESYQKFIKQKGTILNLNTMQNRKSVVTWLYRIHNKVNRKLGLKGGPTLKEVWDKYESFRSVCHKSHVLKKKAKGCTVPLNGIRKKCVINFVDEQPKNGFGKKTKPNDVSDEQIQNAKLVLNVQDENDISLIKKRYRELVMIYHPDKNGGNDEKFKEIANAYEILMQLNKTKFGNKFGKTRIIFTDQEIFDSMEMLSVENELDCKEIKTNYKHYYSFYKPRGQQPDPWMFRQIKKAYKILKYHCENNNNNNNFQQFGKKKVNERLNIHDHMEMLSVENAFDCSEIETKYKEYYDLYKPGGEKPDPWMFKKIKKSYSVLKKYCKKDKTMNNSFGRTNLQTFLHENDVLQAAAVLGVNDPFNCSEIKQVYKERVKFQKDFMIFYKDDIEFINDSKGFLKLLKRNYDILIQFCKNKSLHEIEDGDNEFQFNNQHFGSKKKNSLVTKKNVARAAAFMGVTNPRDCDEIKQKYNELLKINKELLITHKDDIKFVNDINEKIKLLKIYYLILIQVCKNIKISFRKIKKQKNSFGRVNFRTFLHENDVPLEAAILGVDNPIENPISCNQIRQKYILRMRTVRSFIKHYKNQGNLDHLDKMKNRGRNLKRSYDILRAYCNNLHQFNQNNNHFGKKVGKKVGKKSIKLVSIKRSTKSGKKLMATFDTNGRKKVVHFGAAGARDFTILSKAGNKNAQKVKNHYVFRHNKDLGTGDPSRAGFLSMFVLWNKPSLQASIADYRRRLNVYNRTGKFPKNISGYTSPGKKTKYQ